MILGDLSILADGGPVEVTSTTPETPKVADERRSADQRVAKEEHAGDLARLPRSAASLPTPAPTSPN